MFSQVSGNVLKMNWRNVSSTDKNTSVGYFSGLTCAEVNQTIFKYVNLTNEKPKLEMPSFDVNLGEQNISMRINNLTRD